MNYIKALIVCGVGVVAVMASVGTASATTVTASGATYTGTIEAASRNEQPITFDNLGIKCDFSVKANVESHTAGWSQKAVLGVEEMNFTNCTGGQTVTFNATGTFYLQWFGGPTVFAASVGTTITITNHTGLTCSYITDGKTALGLLAGSVATKSTAEGTYNGRFVYHSGGALCHEMTTVTGTYVVSTPDKLDFDF